MESFMQRAAWSMAIRDPRAQAVISGVTGPPLRSVWAMSFTVGLRQIFARGPLQVHFALLDRDDD